MTFYIRTRTEPGASGTGPNVQRRRRRGGAGGRRHKHKHKHKHHPQGSRPITRALALATETRLLGHFTHSLFLHHPFFKFPLNCQFNCRMTCLAVKHRNSVFFRRSKTVFFTVFQTPSFVATVFRRGPKAPSKGRARRAHPAHARTHSHTHTSIATAAACVSSTLYSYYTTLTVLILCSHVHTHQSGN